MHDYLLAQMWKSLDLRDWQERYGATPEHELFQGLQKAFGKIPTWVDAKTVKGELSTPSLNVAAEKCARLFCQSTTYTADRMCADFVNAYEDAVSSRKDLP